MNNEEINLINQKKELLLAQMLSTIEYYKTLNFKESKNFEEFATRFTGLIPQEDIEQLRKAIAESPLEEVKIELPDLTEVFRAQIDQILADFTENYNEEEN